MNPNTAFTFDVLFLAIGLYALVSIIYGRVKHKTFIGDYYGPGGPGHGMFMKFVKNNVYLSLVVIATLLAASSMVYDVFRVLEQPSSTYSIFIVGPAVVIIGFVVMFVVASSIYKRSR